VVDDLDFTPVHHGKRLVAGGTAMIRGKGRDDKEMIYLASPCAKILKYYIQYMKLEDGYLFFSLSNRKSKKGLDTRNIRREVSDLFKRCGVIKTPHRYRHSFTTQTVRKLKGDIPKAMMFTRHKDPKTVMIYHKEIIHKEDLAVVYGE
jgi:integrase